MSIRIGDKIIAANYATQIVSNATTEKAGIIKIATDEEISAGQSTNTAVTPYQLANAATKTQVDNETIEKDESDIITAIGIKSKSGKILYDWIGTQEEYDIEWSAGTIEPDWICWVTDDGKSTEENANARLSNCLLSDPQKVKIEIVDGELVVKAGSILTVPYGIEDLSATYTEGTTFIHENFKVVETVFTNSQFTVWVEVQNDITDNQLTYTPNDEESFETLATVNLTANAIIMATYNVSGTVNIVDNPLVEEASPNAIYLRNDLNKVQLVQSGNESYGEGSLPIAKVSIRNSDSVISIIQQFKSVGYIGSTIWRNKDIRGLLTNYRNEDGTLSSIDKIYSTLDFMTLSDSTNITNSELLCGIYSLTWAKDSDYDDVRNIWLVNDSDIKAFPIGNITVVSGQITKFNVYDPISLSSNWNVDQKVSKSGDIMTGPLTVGSEVTDELNRSLMVRFPAVVFGSAPSTTLYPSIELQDKNGNRMGRVEYEYRTDGSHRIGLVDKKDANTATYAAVTVGFDVDGNPFCNFPKCTTKATTTSSAHNANVAVVVQNYKSGTTWYRVWSDGWIEQGGRTSARSANGDQTITYPKAFSDTNYTVITSNIGNSQENESGAIHTMTISSCTVYAWAGCQTSWYACGY